MSLFVAKLSVFQGKTSYLIHKYLDDVADVLFSLVSALSDNITSSIPVIGLEILLCAVSSYSSAVSHGSGSFILSLQIWTQNPSREAFPRHTV
jgi:hypothetical protein